MHHVALIHVPDISSHHNDVPRVFFALSMSGNLESRVGIHTDSTARRAARALMPDGWMGKQERRSFDEKSACPLAVVSSLLISHPNDTTSCASPHPHSSGCFTTPPWHVHRRFLSISSHPIRSFACFSPYTRLVSQNFDPSHSSTMQASPSTSGCTERGCPSCLARAKGCGQKMARQRVLGKRYCVDIIIARLTPHF